MNNFQTILVAVFMAFFVFAVLVFSDVIKIGGKKGSADIQGKVVVWGVFPRSAVKDVLDGLTNNYKELSISYTQKNEVNYQQELIEAFANGKGPDLFIIDPSMIKRNNNFIYKIPYSSFPEKTFKTSFIDGADIYLSARGVIGLPMIVDPMVMYYNKDILSNEGIVNPPTTWDELFELNKILTKRDNSGAISQSMIALGQYGNINNAKEILSTLLIQNKNNIVDKSKSTVESSSSTKEETVYTAVLNDNPLNYSVSPAQAVTRFFLEFSDLSKTSYSWNRSLPNSLDMFISGKLAFYLGRASELFKIESMNPNLSFDVTQIPQVKDTNSKRTYGEIYAVVINNKSTNFSGAFSVANLMVGGDNVKNISINLSLPPVSRSLLAQKPANNPYLYTFFNSALISRSWIDPNKKETDLIFREMIENILSNKLKSHEAINKAQGQLDLLINK